MKGVKQTIQWMVCRPERKALLSPSHRRACIDLVRSQMKVSERRICRVLGQHRSTQRRLPQGRADEDRLVADMIELARQYSRYGYRRFASLLRGAGWQVNDKRVKRLWKASAAILSEAGMTKKQIGSVLPHVNPSTTTVYTDGASRRRLAASSMEILKEVKW